MAFVYKSEINRSNILNYQSKLGPGEYLDKNPIPELKQHQEPFLSSTILEPKNENPGPGTYYKDFQQIKNLRNLIKSEYNQNINSIIARVNKNNIILQQTEKFGFDSKSKRFKYNNNEDKTPGPGYYFPSILNKEDKNKFKYKKIKKDNDNNRLTFTKMRLNISPKKVGIPSTFVAESEQNKLNNCRKTFQFDNFGCRPKIFDIRKYREFMELNDSNSFNSTNNSDFKKNKNFLSSFYYNKSGVNSIKESKSLKDNFSINDSNNKNVCKNNSQNKSTLSYRVNFCKKINKRKIKTRNKNVLEKLMATKSPGPGYYFDSIYENGINASKPKLNYFQFFGTKARRFKSLDKSWTKMGPGDYFVSDIKNNEKDKDDVYIPFGSSGKRDNSFLNLKNTKLNPGPGEYEIESFTNNAELNIISDCNKQFGMSGERFNDKHFLKDKYNSPGPGYYDPKNSSIGIINNDILKIKKGKLFFQNNKPNYKIEINKLKNTDNQFLNGINESLQQFKYKEKIPPVGYYYPEFYNTIDYKNKKKLFESKQEGICFNRTITNKLKKHSSTSDILGPSYYNINKETKKNIYYQVKPPFHSSSERMLIPKKKEKYNINFDDYKQYYMKEYFNWNKKSHNINFI